MQEPEPSYVIILVRRSGLSTRRPARRRAPPAPSPPTTKPRRRLPVWHPSTRADCLPGGKNAVRPCAFASCRHSLLVDIDCETAEVRQTAEDPAELPYSCALDVAEVVDSGDRTMILRSLSPFFGVTRERIRQLELRAIEAFQRGMARKPGEKLPKVLASPWGTTQPRAHRKPKSEED